VLTVVPGGPDVPLVRFCCFEKSGSAAPARHLACSCILCVVYLFLVSSLQVEAYSSVVLQALNISALSSTTSTNCFSTVKCLLKACLLLAVRDLLSFCAYVP
jgi:hypothetical protein